MKNKLFALICIFILAASMLAACGSSKVEEDVWTVISEKDREDYSHEYTEIQYDDNGNVISKNDGNPITITYEYDGNGLLTKETSTHTLYGIEESTYEYDENGLVILETFKSENRGIDGLVYTYTYEFDDSGLVKRMVINNSVDGDPTVYDFTYDDNGKITSKSETDGSYISKTDYTYDENGNVSKSYTKFDDGTTLNASYTYEKTGTRSYDPKNTPVAEKYRYFRENWNK